MATQNAVNTTLSGQTGTGSFVGSTSPTLVTPILGAATATSINFGGSTLSNYVSLTSWTPIITFGTPGNLSVSYTSQLGSYSRIGDIVFANFFLQFIPTYTTSSGNFLITGLPIASNATSGNFAYGAIDIGSAMTFPAGITSANAELQNGVSSLFIRGLGSTTQGTLFVTTQFPTTLQQTILGSIVYQV